MISHTIAVAVGAVLGWFLFGGGAAKNQRSRFARFVDRVKERP